MIHTDNTQTLVKALNEIERLNSEIETLSKIAGLAYVERDAYKAQHDEQVTLVLELAAERDAATGMKIFEMLSSKSFMHDTWHWIATVVTTHTPIPNTPHVWVTSEAMNDLRKFWESINPKIAAIDKKIKGEQS